MFLKNNLGKIELCFLVKKIILVFDELNLRSYFLDYDFKIFKLWFKIYLMLSMLFEEYWSELLLVKCEVIYVLVCMKIMYRFLRIG